MLRRRRMVREYEDRPLPPDVEERVVASALRAPSAGFSQGWAFLVLTAPEDRRRFWRHVPTRVESTPRIQNAPLVVVPLSHRDAYLERYARSDKGWTDRDEARWPVPYWYLDTAMATLLMLLTAVDEGLGACFFGIAPENVTGFRADFDVPEAFTPIGAVSVGVRAADLEPQAPSVSARRRPPGEVVHRGRFGRQEGGT